MPTKLPPKPYKTVQQQLDTYKQRGLIVDDNKKHWAIYEQLATIG